MKVGKLNQMVFALIRINRQLNPIIQFPKQLDIIELQNYVRADPDDYQKIVAILAV